MKTIINKKEVNVFIERKRSNKNTYIRVKEDLNIYITTNYLTSDKYINNLINKNINSITKMYNHMEKKLNNLNNFSYLGKKYDIVYINSNKVILGEDKIFIPKDYNLDNWLIKQAKRVFKEELDKFYNIFPYDISYPSLVIRKMKTRWGVCNIKLKKITLNLELIKKDIKYLDYVIVHELSHLVVNNHSKEFYDVVKILIPNYKEIRKEMKEYE